MAIAGLAGGVLLAQLGLTVANIGLPSMMTAFGASFGAVQWVVLSYLITMTALAVYAGRLGDRFGKRRLLYAGLGLFALSSVLCAVTPSLDLLIAGRALQGAAAALLNALSLALVVDLVGSSSAGGGVGFISSASALGTMIGPTVGALVIGAGGWRAIFALNVPLAAAVYFAVRATSPAAASPASQSQARAPAPPVAGRFPPALVISLAMNVLVSGVMVSTLILAPFVLSRTFGLTLHNVGLVMGAGPTATVGAAILAGRLADRVNGRFVGLAGLGLFTCGAVGLATLRTDIGLIGYIVPVLLIGFGYGVFQTSNNAVILAECDPRRRGVVSGWLGLSRNAGLIGGAALIGAMFGAVTHGDAQSGPVVAAAMRSAFGIATGMGTLAIILAVFVCVIRPRAAILA